MLKRKYFISKPFVNVCIFLILNIFSFCNHAFGDTINSAYGFTQIDAMALSPGISFSAHVIKKAFEIVNRNLSPTEITKITEGDKGNKDTIYGELGFNPLLALRYDQKIRNVFQQIVERRYDIRVLSEVYGLGGVPHYLTSSDGSKLSVAGYVKKMVDFLVKKADQNPHYVARQFREAFPNMARPPELDAIFDKYMKIKIKEFDLEVVHDALPKDSIIADIGAGKNKLGKQILEYSDQNKLNVKYVIGTDIEDWSDKQGRPDSRLSFILQESSIQFPLSSNTYDAIIVKWVLHHMNEEDQKAFLKSIHHILKPGGCLIILDSLGATIEDKEILEGFLKETGNSRTWPAGSFYEANYKLTMDFMKLTPQQQLQVHALEDFFGHNLIMGRNWMPQPFSYRTVAEFKEFLGRLGFNENKELRRVYGSAPIMRMGPPSIRLVFEKERRKPLFIAGGGGNNKAMVLIDGMGPGEKEHVRNILDVLEARDLSKQEIMRKKFDDIVLLGNERLDTFSETLELLNGGIGERIVILGNYGKATIPLIDVAVSNGYKIELAGKFVVDENNWWDIKRILKIDELRDIITVSEANIIRQIMLQIINANTTDFEPLRQRIEKEGIEDIIIVADSSEITQKLLVQYRQMLDQKKVFERTTPYDILLAQNPYRQLRGKAAFIELLSSEIAQGKVSIVSHTTSFDNIASTKSIVYPDLLEEAWRLVLYSDYGNIFINLRSEKYPRGIDDIPNIFWQSAAVLFDSLNNIEKKRLADRLVSLLEKERLSIDDICKTTNFSLREFIVKIVEARTKISILSEIKIQFKPAVRQLESAI